MNNLGDILKEARTAKGVSIRDAADATKIRGDFLSNMEAGDFNFNLPEIYKRGFLRLYAEYLKLDKDAVLANYSAYISGQKSQSDKDSPKIQQTKSQFLDKLSADSEGLGSFESEAIKDEFNFAPPSPLQTVKTFGKSGYGKITAILLGVIVLIAAIVGIVSLTGEKDSNAPAANANAAECTIVITALRDTSYNLVYESNKQNFLHKDRAAGGSTETYKTKEPLILTPTNINDISVSRNGLKVNLPAGSLEYRLIIPNP